MSQIPVSLEFFSQYDDIAALQADPANLENLVTFGIESCSRIAVVGGAEAEAERAMVDAKVVMIGNMVETYLRNRGIDPYSNDRFCVYELQDEKNLKLLPVPPQTDAIDPSQEVSEYATDLLVDLAWRTVSGCMIPSNNIATLFARAFFAPGIMDIFEALVSPSKSRTIDPAMPWRAVLLPSFAGITYGDLMKRIATNSVPGLMLGLFRPPGSHGCVLGYVFTNPPPATVIQKGDCAYVLAGSSFAECLDADNNLLSLSFGSETGSVGLNKPENGVTNKGDEAIVTTSTVDADDLVKASIGRLFDRYDLNCSGTIDTVKELQMLTVSAFFDLHTKQYAPVLGLRPEEMEAMSLKLADEVEEPFQWTLEEYTAWFIEKFQPR